MSGKDNMDKQYTYTELLKAADSFIKKIAQPKELSKITDRFGKPQKRSRVYGISNT